MAVACEDHQASRDLRDAIYAYEIDQVEATLSAPDGSLSDDDIRCLYSHFHIMRPNTAEFVTHWLDRHPNSSQAKLAKALVLAKFSQPIRGSRPPSMTYVGALIEARGMIDEAQRLISDVRLAEPKLVSTLDVLAELEKADRSGAFFNPNQLEMANPSREALAHAPLDTQLVRTLLPSAETPAEQLDYAARLLLASPYEPDHWQAYLLAQMSVEPISYAEGEPYRVNQLVFANHSPRALQRFVLEKLEALETAKQSQNTSNTPEVVLCPTIRAARLHRYTCSFARDRGCTIPEKTDETLRRLEREAQAQGICFEARNLPPQALKFNPVDVSDLNIRARG